MISIKWSEWPDLVKLDRSSTWNWMNAVLLWVQMLSFEVYLGYQLSLSKAMITFLVYVCCSHWAVKLNLEEWSIKLKHWSEAWHTCLSWRRHPPSHSRSPGVLAVWALAATGEWIYPLLKAFPLEGWLLPWLSDIGADWPHFKCLQALTRLIQVLQGFLTYLRIQNLCMS